MKPHFSNRWLSMLVILFALDYTACANAVAAEPAVVALEQATTSPAQLIAVNRIRDALGPKALSEGQIERVATVLALTPTRQDNPGYAPPTPAVIKLLQDQLDNVVASARTITILAESLANDTIHSMNSAAAIASLIGQQLKRQSLPSAALTTLFGALDHEAMSNRTGAIDALSHLPWDDHRRANILEEFAYTLSHNNHHHTRLTLIRALTRMNAEAPLEGKVLGTVAKLTSNDPYLTVRLEALEFMATRSLPHRMPSNGNQTLIKELLQPTQELWQKSQGTREHTDLRPRAIEYLRNWYRPKYPPDLVQVFINECKGSSPQQSLEILLELRLRDGLSDSQLFELRDIAANHPQSKWREAIYQLALPSLVQGSVVDAEQAFVHSGNNKARIEAGYALLQSQGDQPVPGHVAKLAIDVLTDAKDLGLREVAAKLIAQSELPQDTKEQILLSALRQGLRDPELPDILLSGYNLEGLDGLAVRHVEDTSLPMGFRALLIQRIGQSPGRAMPQGLSSALRRTAEASAATYSLIGSIRSTLIARHEPVPIIVTLKGKLFQSKVLSIVWLICLFSATIIAISTLIGVFHLPFNGKPHRAKRVALASAWLAGTVVMFGFLAVGFVGFLGHNSAPSPTSTLAFNLPLYAALLVYLPLGVVITWRAWRSRKTARVNSLRPHH